MINIIKKCCSWARKHTFHFVVVIILVFAGFAIATQQVMINLLQDQIDEVPDLIKKSETSIKSWSIDRERVVIGAMSEIKKTTFELIESTNARIDVIDSAIKPDKKRRVLITKIRNAITENTNTKLTIRELNNIAIAVIDYSHQYNLSIARVLAQIRVESNFDIRAKSKAGALGLMQIMPQTMEYIESKIGKKLNSYNIYDNINAGTFYINKQLYEFGNLDLALQSYNFGPDNLKKYIAGERKVLPEETQKYVPSVNKWFEIFTKYGLE